MQPSLGEWLAYGGYILKGWLSLSQKHQLPVTPVSEVGTSRSTPLSMLGFGVVRALPGLKRAITTTISSYVQLPGWVHMTALFIVIYCLWLSVFLPRFFLNNS